MLSYLLVKIFKKMMFHVVLNLSITSIPPRYYTGYLEDTQHLITVNVYIHESHSLSSTYSLNHFTTPVTKQLSLWCAFTFISNRQSYYYPLTMEDTTMKVYARKGVLPIDIPFGNIKYNHAAVQHFKDFNAIIALQHLSDYSSSYLLVIEDPNEDIPFGHLS